METKFKILLSVFILLFGVWAGLSVYNKYWKTTGANPPPINLPPAGQLPQSAEKSEEERIKSLAEDFVRRYASYTLGDFSGLEGLKEQMTSELWREKSASIDAQKQALANQPKHYITFSAFPEKSAILSYNDNQASLEVDYLLRETKGATIHKETTIYIDEFGQEGKPVPPSIDSEKKIRLEFVKADNVWKVSAIIKVEHF